MIHPPHTLYSETRSSTQHENQRHGIPLETTCRYSAINYNILPMLINPIPDVSQHGETLATTTSIEHVMKAAERCTYKCA